MYGVDAQATKELQEEKGRYWYISINTLWELMQIQDYHDYDKKLFNATYLFQNKILKSPAELLIDFIKKGCPDYHLLDNPFSESIIAQSWEKACADKSYSFSISNTSAIDKTKWFKKISTNIPYIIEYNKPNTSKNIDADINEMKNTIFRIYEILFDDNVNDQVVYLRKISLLLCLLILCMGYDLSGDILYEYWDKRKIEKPIDRLVYLLTKNIKLLSSGPFWIMSNVVLIQLQNLNKASRGALFDGLHSIYLPYVDSFVTKDKHFVKIRNSSTVEYRKLYYDKIVHIDELKLIKNIRRVKIT